MRFGMGWILVALGAVTLVGAQGCATDAQEVAEVGQLRMALTATSSLGATYRLADAQFRITGPTTTTFDAGPFLDDEFATIDLSIGPYEIQLLSGWTLEKLGDDNVFTPVVAGRAGSAFRSFVVNEGETTEVSYSFRTASDEVTFGMGELAVGITVQEIPSAWTCLPGYYDADDGCDCGCGVPDPDCAADPGGPLYGCETGQTCTEWGTCEGAFCGDGNVDAGEACDDGNDVNGDGCSRSCQVETPAPSGWTCNAEYYDAADGCDCECGAVDPDCSISGAQLWGCAAGQVCSAAGLCVAP